jgi:hypothetical protein
MTKIIFYQYTNNRLSTLCNIILYIFILLFVDNNSQNKFIDAINLRMQQKLPTKAPAWYKNFPPWWMNPSALKAEASNYVNTMESPVPIPPKPANPNPPDKTKAVDMDINQPKNPLGPPPGTVGKSIVPPPGTKPITDNVLYGGGANAALSIGAKGSAIYNAIVNAKASGKSDKVQDWEGTLLGDLSHMQPPSGNQVEPENPTPSEDHENTHGGNEIGDNENEEMEEEQIQQHEEHHNSQEEIGADQHSNSHSSTADHHDGHDLDTGGYSAHDQHNEHTDHGGYQNAHGEHSGTGPSDSLDQGGYHNAAHEQQENHQHGGSGGFGNGNDHVDNGGYGSHHDENHNSHTSGSESSGSESSHVDNGGYGSHHDENHNSHTSRSESSGHSVFNFKSTGTPFSKLYKQEAVRKILK